MLSSFCNKYEIQRALNDFIISWSAQVIEHIMGREVYGVHHETLFLHNSVASKVDSLERNC